MGQVNKRIKVCFLWCFIFMLPLLGAQELDAFDQNTTIDFARENILADMEPVKDNTLNSFVEDSVTVTVNRTSPIGINDKISDVLEKTSTQQNYIITETQTVDNVNVSKMSESATKLPDLEKSLTSTESLRSNLSGLENINETPPHIRWPLTQERVVVLEQRRKGFTVRCSADGYPEPTFKWFRNGVHIKGVQKYFTAFDNGTLFFVEYSKRENGLYQCTATNKHGTSVSVITPIMYEQPPGPMPDGTVMKQVYQDNEGRPMEFKCVDTPPTIPDYTRRWYFQISTVQLQTTDRIGTDSKGVIRFAYLEKSDENTYSCALAPDIAEAGDTIKLYNTAELKVKDGTIFSTTPKLAYASSNVKAVFGRNVTLECFFSGYPVANISWRKRNSDRNIPEGDNRYVISKKDFRRKLIIVSVQDEDADYYICTGSNGYGTAFGEIYVNVTGPPQKIAYQGLDTINKPEGDTEILKCKARAIGQQILSTPEWYRNGQPFNESNLPFPERYKFNKDRTELTITNLNKIEDTACFQCNVTNSEGYLFYDGYIKVIDRLPTAKPQVEVKESGGMSLWWLGIIGGVLLILIAVVIIIVFIKSNYPGDTYLLEKAEIKHNLNPEKDLLDQSFQEV